MANRFYEPGEQRASRVNDLFAAIAPRYDLINDLQSCGMHRYWKRRLVQQAGVRPGERALDLCCGTGDIAFALARQGAQVVGLDFSPPMLAAARTRLREQTPPAGSFFNPQFLRGDALSVPFPADRFDIVTIAYGLRNLANFEQGLSEMWRVARPGGRLLVLDFGKPGNALWRSLYFGYLKRFVPLFGKIYCRDAETYAYILESLEHYPAQDGVAANMRRLNGVNTRRMDLLGGAMSINYCEKRVGIAPALREN
ncbi:MAG: bifunctional demethylmenaquinone methyltransferase/2-methoxy-6-polyprenyl-1,4-benzoquinol methylase UbiE [Verrucomicrobia bacterium]|nr:MAG: bifunctional demethylmenaquinone methyltransferase/2-methoxy-6-polyprenyl-1,4-benzoquinol methylase UbiE [Verrucomicrobiota bacterium]